MCLQIIFILFLAIRLTLSSKDFSFVHKNISKIRNSLADLKKCFQPVKCEAVKSWEYKSNSEKIIDNFLMINDIKLKEIEKGIKEG